MLEYAGSQRAGRRERDALASPRRRALVRLDPRGRPRGSPRRRALGDRRRDEPRPSRATRTTTSTGRSSTPRSAGSCSSAAALVDPGSLSPLLASHLRRDRRPHRGRLPRRPRGFGSTRWINLGFFTFQPSEFGKLLVVLALAGLLAERQQAIGEWRTTLQSPALGALPVLLVFIQPDLGTALVYMAALAAMLFVAGTPWRHLVDARDDRRASRRRHPVDRPGRRRHSSSRATSRQRLTCFVDPRDAAARAGLQPQAVEISVGAGQLRGVGPNGSSQVNSGFLPAHTPTSRSRASRSSAASSAP